MSQNYQGPPQQGNFPQGPQQAQPQGPQPQLPPPAWQQGAPVPPNGPVPTKRKSKKTMIIASILALALLAGGGIIAWSLLRGAAPAAAKGIPSNAVAVLEVNLNPAVGDKLAVKDLAMKFPYLKEQSSDAGDDYKKAVWSTLAKLDEHVPDYESEVKPWLGDSIAVAALPAKESGSRYASSSFVLSFQVSNKEAAKSFADKHFTDSKTVFVDDLMVVTNDTDSDISESSLKDNITSVEAYKADMGKLGDGYLATAWLSSDLIKQVVGSQSTTEITDLIESRSAMGLKVQDGALALRSITWQKDEIKDRGENVKDLAGSMPGDWLGSFTFSLSPNLVDKMWEKFSSMPSSTQRQLEDVGISSADDLRALFGSQLSFAVSTGEMQSFQFGIKVRTKDPEKHKSIVEKIAKNTSVKNLETKVDGDTVITTVGGSPESFANPGDKLSGNSEHEKLTKGIDDPQFSAWVNAPRIIELVDRSHSNGMPAQVKENLEPLSGVGMVAGKIDDHYSDSWLRVGTK